MRVIQISQEAKHNTIAGDMGMLDKIKLKMQNICGKMRIWAAFAVVSALIIYIYCSFLAYFCIMVWKWCVGA